MGTNTGIGIGIGIPFRNNALGGDNIYFPPELKARMIGVWDNYGKKNTDADRNIIKNKIPNAGGDLEILNSAYKLNSGFGEYREDFTSWIVSKEPMTVEKTDSQVHISYIGTSYKELPMFEYSGPINENYSLTVEIQGIPNNVIGKFIHNNGFTQEVTNGINTIKFSNSGSWYGFTFYREDNTIIGDCNITIKQIPAFEGALVTDGINDIIASIKTLEDWNIGNKGITIVSMIHQINTNTNNFITTNNIRTDNKVIGRNIVSNIEKTGIYGWYKENIQSDTINVINNILGDKNDYTSHSSPSTNINPINNSKFYVQGYAIENGFAELSSVAHYWTFAVLGKATEDEINLIIAKYNLDRTLRPDILCNITKQGITNDNHADFNDKLVDYSGNGRDIQMYNLAWKGSSGVAAKKFETIKDYLIVPDEGLQELTIYNEFSYKVKSIKHADRYWTIQTLNKTDVSYPITIVSDKNIIWRNAINYTDENGVKRSIRKETNVPANTPTQVFVLGFNDFDVPDNYTKVNCVAYATRTDITEFTVIFIPSCKGGILLDGIEDFGKVTGMPIYKDYTFIIEREFLNETFPNQVCLVSESKVASEIENGGAFIVDNISVNSIINPYSFYKTTSLPGLNTFDRQIVFQSKYKYLDKDIAAGTATNSDTLWLGTFRDNDSRFANVAIYSLMSFPYSMSKFLIERQLKKHKLGTLYPDMVEFRPVIKSNIDIKKINYWDKDWNILHIGDYVSIGNDVKTNITVPNGYKISKVTSNAFDNITIEKSSTDFIYDVKFYGIKKSPQKIGITIEQDENYVLFNPVITSNVEYHKLDFYLNNYQKRINIGDYIPKDAYLRANFYLKNNVDELTAFIFNGVNIGYRRSSVDDIAFNIGHIYNYDSPQEVNITIDEYIRYEDIVQPYPILLGLRDENDNEVSWGDKLRVGSTATFTRGLKDSDLLYGMYKIDSIWLNNENMIVVADGRPLGIEKKMEFRSAKEWLLDNNEPKCILSPRLLRIPNSSYKILGHIPDISGHGNHGKINNSAYAGMSGANGYKQDFTSWKTSGSSYSIVTDSKYILTNEKAITNGGYFLWNRLAKDSFKVKISNIPNGGWMSYRYKITEEDTQFSSLFIRKDGIYTLPATIADSEVDFFISTVSAPAKDWIGLTIEQIGEYEGAYCLDGVDDFVTIPTLSSGGKQVLMKVNWSSLGMPIYEQRTPGKKNFAIISNSTAVAYIEGNDGNTYIDGILNNNIKGNELVNITHNITITNELSEKPNTSPMISMNNGRNAFAKMSLYDFMLFDDISTDDKIKELNEYVGVEAKVELPPYYWDTYGKTNSDADKDTIQQRGVAVGDYDLTNNNFAYDNMSGFGGYTLGKFTNSWSLSNNSNSISIVSRNPYDITLKKLGENSDWEFNTTELKIISNPVSVKFKSDKNIRFTCDYHYYPVGGNSEGTPLRITSKDLIANKDAIITISPISQENIDKYNIDVNRGYYLIYFQLSFTLAVNEEVTIEMLPLYPNGLVYDGVTDYSENANIPAFTDFTYILKRQILKGIANSAVMYKGNITVNQGGAFICNYCEPSDTNLFTDFSFGGLLRSNDIDKPIIYGTKTSVNGDSITPGENIDTVGINVGKWVNYLPMVFYKLILYPKTIPLLQINFLKNLMERDEIIDLNNPIFKNESNAL